MWLPLLSLFAPPAHAGELDADAVFVAPFATAPGADPADAARLSGVARDSLGDDLVALQLRDVPAFPDYDAATYLNACPAGDRLGCVYVLAERGGAVWAIDGIVTGAGAEAHATVTFLDVAGARTVFALTVPAADDTALASSLDATLAWILAGGVEIDDLRGEFEGARAEWEEGRRAADDKALQLVGMEEELGAALDLGGRAVLAPTKLTTDDLAAMVGEDDAIGPWDKAGMDQDTWLRFKNSGLTQEQWWARDAGRAGTFIARIALGGGLSPTGVRYEAAEALDPGTFEAVETQARQEAAAAVGPWGGVELGVGLLRTLELGVSARGRFGPYDVLSTVRVVGDVIALPVDQVDEGVLTWDVGGYVQWTGAPLSTTRPVVHAGASWWRAPKVDKVADLQTSAAPMDPISRLLIRAAPGLEAEVAPGVALVARAVLEVPVGSGRVEASTGDGTWTELSEPAGAPPISAGVDLGLQIKLPSVRSGPSRSRTADP